MNEIAPTDARETGTPPTAAPRRAWPWLLLFMLLQVALVASLAAIRVSQLKTATWDMGIYQQALWSTGHGRPFYESPDFETGGFGSFLQVHSAFLLYLVVPLYQALPSQWLLIGLQTTVVAAAAVPLYALTRQLTRSAPRALLAAGLYLVWTPTVGGALFDFHVEAFLPLELFSLVYLLERRQMLAAAVVALLAFLTMEAAPVLTFAVGIFFLVERWVALRPSSAPVAEAEVAPPLSATIATGLSRLASDRLARAATALATASVVAYYLLLLLRTEWLSAWFGFPPFPTASVGYIIGGTPSSLGLSLTNLNFGFQQRVTYWVLAYALVGFLPLLAPRTLILSAPWLTYTFFGPRLAYIELGNQYGFIAACGLLIGAAYGLAKLRPLTWPALFAPVFAAGRRTTARARPVLRVWMVGVAAIIVVNVALTPLNLYMQGPDYGGAYRISYAGTPGFANAVQLAALVPSGAPVVASSDVFPLVANDLHAYTFFYKPTNGLTWPFNASHLPNYVFLSQLGIGAVPAWLSSALYNTSTYGMRGEAWATPVGALLLFELGYSGTSLALGVPPPSNATFSAAGLTPSTVGAYAPGPGGRASPAIQSVQGSAGQVWAGPGVNLPPGRFQVSVELEVQAVAVTGSYSGPSAAVKVSANAFAHSPWFTTILSYPALAGRGWVWVTVGTISSASVLVNVQVPGFCQSAAYEVAVAAISLAPI